MRMVDQAIQFAAAAHRNDLRKQKDVPYITHPFAVALLLAEAGCSEAVICAGILHDTLEDTNTEPKDLMNQFGMEVLRLVEGASEPDKKKTWQERKEHTMAVLPLAPSDVCMIVCADKLHNLREIRHDLQKEGDSLWSRFNAGKAKQEWYYRGIARAIESKIGHTKLHQDLVREIWLVFGDENQ